MPTAPRKPAAPFGPALLLAVAVAACSSSSGPPAVPGAFTVHLHRPLGDYAGWVVEPSEGAVETSATSSTRDGFGALYSLTVKQGAPRLAFALRKGAEADPAGTLEVDVSGAVREAWVISGHPEAITRALPALPATGVVAVYYLRADGDYAGWGLHLWGERVTETAWSVPLQPVGVDPQLGAGFLVPVRTGGALKDCAPGQVCLIVHKGDTKDPGPNMGFDPAEKGDLVFLLSGSAEVTSVPRKVGALSVSGAAAHLLARDRLAWNVTDPAAATFELRYSATAEVRASGSDVVGGQAIPLVPNPAGVGAGLEAKAPYVKGWPAFDVPAAHLAAVPEALKGQLVAVARKADGSALAATQVQTAFALDDLFVYEGPLGVAFAADRSPTFRLWAPTAQSVRLHVRDAAGNEVAGSPFDMTPGAQGVWSHAGPAGWYGQSYRFELLVYHPISSRIERVEVTDPYAVNLSPNGLDAQIVDLSDPALRPAGWDALAKPPLEAPEDIVLYETHLRDFSATDATVPAARRGKFLAFTTEGGATPSNGLQHLAAMAAAGLTHVHLLPVFDIATVGEDPAGRVDLDQDFSVLCARNPAVPAALCGQLAGKTIAEALASLPGDSDQQQAIAGWMKALDSYNWGYDPLHYGAPEGSYASAAGGTERIVEFRSMVKGLADIGLRVVMDVVYNHTNASGLSPKSVLDKVVPGYYHRLDPVTGFVLTSSCCANTATEHRMMERLMVDTAVRWARDYKVDGFRFDLMGLHLKSNMLAVQAALAALTPAVDGVDGSRIYVYGEGWEMGEMARRSRGVNANQANMAGTGIGTFNDRLRDGVRGGGPFDTGPAVRRNQGLATGLYTDPNELGTALPADRQALIEWTDRVKIGMAGGLADFRLVTASGSALPASAVGYSGQAAGYTEDPQESINYVSAHDNLVLWDAVQAKLPTGEGVADRVRAHLLAMDTVLLGQGVPFLHMGDDLLRSKSMDKNSYDSGDWFNRVDWSAQSNGWRSGLPIAADNSAEWPLVTQLFADSTIAPTATEIAAARAHVQEMLRVRKSSRLLRLATKADVTKRVDFLNVGPDQVAGVIVMTVTDATCAGADVDAQRDGVVVIVNADRASHTMTVPGASGARLHPVLAASADPVVRTASVAGEDFTVPARTSAVFELPAGAAPGAGLPCNAR
jgi:pullulanase-type alpha-1,6-glucosidase